MEKYPVLKINLDTICNNAKIIMQECNKFGINVTAVIKGCNADIEVIKQIIAAGYKQFASSRISHLKKIKNYNTNIETMLLRVPMDSDIDEIIECCDISLNSEIEIIEMLDKKAAQLGRVHKVILMRDLGDLREGIFDSKIFIDTACYIENNLNNIHLYGVGTNLSCYGSVIPTVENLSELCNDAEIIESKINRKLEVISGGATTSLPLIYYKTIPKRINNLRVGEGMILGTDLLNYWRCGFEGLRNDGFILEAKVIEIGCKPTHPIGNLCINAFGEVATYEDKGIRNRALLAIGNFDLGDSTKLIPLDSNIHVLGASSDHMIVDIHNCETNYKLGDIISFKLMYQNMLFLTNNQHVNIRYISGCI